MLTIEQRLHVLTDAGLPAASVAAALIVALEHAEPTEREAIAQALLETGTSAAYAALIRHRPRMAEDAAARLYAALVADPSPTVVDGIGQALGDTELRVQREAVALATDRPEPALLPRLAALVDDSRDELPTRAAGAVLALMTRILGKRGRGRIHEADRQLVDRALADLLERASEHRQDAALLAVAMAMRQAKPPLRRMLDDPAHPGALALRRVVRLTEHPIVARNLLNWLTSPPLHRPVLRWMHRVEGEAGFSDLLDGGHLLLHPARRRAMRQVDRPMRCVPDVNESARIDDRVQHRLPDLIMALSISTARRVRMLANGVALPAPLARLRCALALEGPAMLNAPQATVALDRFLFDRDVAVATTTAWRRMGLPGEVHREILEHIETRAIGAIAAEASVRLAAGSVRQLCNRVNRLSFTAALAAASTCLERDRHALIVQFQQELEGGDRSLRLRLIALIRRLRLVEACVEALLSCARHTDVRIASAAVSALGPLNMREVRSQLRASLEHEDARVRANAVEALAGTRDDEGDADRNAFSRLALGLAEDESNRLRANAIRTIIDSGDARGLDRLNTMLRDRRSLHRVSALWLARRSCCADVVPAVRTLAQDDESAEIRIRAERAARFLEASAQSRTKEAVFS